MIDNKYFIIFLVAILLVLIVINYNLMLEKESFEYFENSDDLSTNLEITDFISIISLVI